MPMPISLFGQVANGNGKEDSAFPMPEQTGAAASPMPKAFPAPYGMLQSKNELKAVPQQEQSINTFLERLAREDTNIDALLGWGLVPRIEDGKLKLKGAAKLAPEALDGLKRWLAHIGPNGEARREQIIRALTTGRKATC